MHSPLELPLGAVKIAAVDPGPAKSLRQFGRFAMLRRLGPTRVIPRTEGIDGWLWTSTGGTGLTNLGEDDEAPNVALSSRSRSTSRAARGVRPRVRHGSGRALAARQPRGPGVLFRVADALAAELGFRRWGFQDVLTDKEVPPTLRRHLPTDRPADPTVSGGGARRRAGDVGAAAGHVLSATRYGGRRDPARARTSRRPRSLPRLPRDRPGDLQQGRRPRTRSSARGARAPAASSRARRQAVRARPAPASR